MRKLILFFVFLSASLVMQAQEFQSRVSVITSRISSQVNRNIFQTLQTGITNLINNRKWSKDAFQPNEKIKCNFLLNIEEDLGNNIYRGRLTIQAARPVYNSTYDSPIINYIDNDVVFKYQEFQPIEFNENRIQGADPAAANLTAIFAYYINIILGFDYSSFALKSGDEYFKKAWNIVNNAPDSREITGWKSFDGLRNRYWLAENLNSNRFGQIHDVLYSYYRGGMDIFYENPDEARNGIINSLNFLTTINTENPNSMILQFFFQGKSNELVKTFSQANTDIKTKAKEMLLKLDITNTSSYKEL